MQAKSKMAQKQGVWAGITGILFLLFAHMSATPLHAQAVASAQIAGTVMDSSGSVIPNAKVSVTQTNTGLVRNTVSGPDGNYVFPNLPVGPYTLHAEAQGFSAYEQSGIILQVSNNVSVKVTLGVGSVQQQVVVTADAAMVNTQETSVSQVIGNKQVNELPLNGREATQLILLSGFSTNLPPNDVGGHDLTGSKTYGSADIAGSATISVAGGQANGTTYLMDGGYNTNAFSNASFPFPLPDAIQEFSVQTNGLNARYGVHPGGQVNVITKSGTNSFHGNLFEFIRNGDADARPYFAKTRDTLRRNQFGGTVGGPIMRQKLFFFFGYQGTRIRTAPPSTISYVPTQAMLNGDFSQFESAGCQSSGKARTITNPATNMPYTGDHVDTTQFNAQSLNILKNVPIATNPCGLITYGIPNPENEDQYIGRVDWNQSSKNSVFGRYFITSLENPPVYNGNLLYTTRAGVLDRDQTFVLGDTYTLRPSTINSFHGAWVRSRVNRGSDPNVPNPQDVGINISSPIPNFLYLGVTNDFSTGCSTCATGIFNTTTEQLADDVDIVHGPHWISFGVDWIHNHLNEVAHSEDNGQFDFIGTASGDPMLDFMLGLPTGTGSNYAFAQGNPNIQHWRQNYISLYAQDQVKVNNHLNVHFGVRWEPFLPETDVNQLGDHFDATAFTAGTKTKVYANAPPGIFFNGDPGIPPGYTSHKLNIFEPRVGLVWDPTGSGKQSVTASYGIFSDLVEIFYGDHFADSPPWGSRVNITNPPSITNPYASYPGGDPFPLPYPPTFTAPFILEALYITYPLHTHPPVTQEWSLGYQLQASRNWLFSATYMGNITNHMWAQTEANPAVYIPGVWGTSGMGCSPIPTTGPGAPSTTAAGTPCSTTGNTNSRRALTLENSTYGPYYSNIPTLVDAANAEYNGLLLSAKHRLSDNYMVLANYTWSHCISDSDFGQELGAANYQNPADLKADRGNCDYDVRNSFIVSFVATSPKFGGKWDNRLLGGWQLAPILSHQSGFWFSPLTGVDNSLTGVGLDRPNVVGNPYNGPGGELHWINPAAFVPNALGTFGDAGRDSLVGPSYTDLDVETSKFIHLHREHQMEVRFEAFNVLNHTNFENPVQTESSSAFGVIQASNPPRILQAALKYSF